MKITRKLAGYTTLTFGMMGIIYGFSEYMYALKSVQYILGALVEAKPNLYDEPLFQAIINVAIGQAVSMKVLTYIVPGFILSAFGVTMLFLSDIINRLDKYSQFGNEMVKGVTDLLDGKDEFIEPTDEVEKE